MASLPRATCAVHAEVLATKAKTKQSIKEIKKKIRKVIKKRGEILWGLVDNAASSLITAISTIAQNIAQSLLAKASAAAASVLNAILENLLSTLLGSIGGAYALAAIPHERAVDSIHNERKYLELVKSRLFIISSVISKWARKTSTVDYLSILNEVLPVIEEVNSQLTKVITALESNENSTFDVASYNKAVKGIKQAISLTDPETAIDSALNPEERIEARKAEILEAKIIEIKSKYRGLRNQAAKDYKDKVAGDATGNIVDDLTDKAVEYAERVKYKAILKKLEISEKFEMSKAEATSYRDAAGDFITNGIGQTLRSTKDEFTQDMILLKDNLRFLPDEIGQAYLHNKSSQSLCSTLFNFKSLITRIVNLLIRLIRGIGNATGNAASGPVGAAYAAASVAEDFVREGIEEYSEPSNRMAASKAAMKMVAARSALIGADTILSAAITESLIELINLDDNLVEGNDEYESFTGRLSNIPDWDGTRDQWTLGLATGAVNPYIRLILNSGRMVVNAAGAVVPGRTANERLLGINESITEINSTIDKIESHNAQVYNVLISWNPPKSEAADRLRESLMEAGLLNLFAHGLSLMSTLKALGAEMFDGEPWESCPEAYPDLYENPVVKKELESSRRQYPTLIESDSNGLMDRMDNISDLNADFAYRSDELNIANDEELNITMDSLG